MKSLIVCSSIYFMLGAGAAAAATTDADVAAPIHQFVDAFDKGDGATAAAAHWTEDLTIVDEVPPYVWKGPQAFATWAHDLAADDAKGGVNGEKVTLGAVSRTEIEGDNAYVVVPRRLQLQGPWRGDERAGADDLRLAQGIRRMADQRVDMDRAEAAAGPIGALSGAALE